MAQKITSEEFNTKVLSSKKPVLIDFYADWCGPCKMLAPVIDQISNELENVDVYKINIDEKPQLA